MGQRTNLEFGGRKNSSRPKPRRSGILFFFILLGLVPLPASAQIQSIPDGPAPEQQAAPAGPTVTVHGIVRDAATGQPLARALVAIAGGTGTLTDGEGRFEIPGVTAEYHDIQISKPGYTNAENEFAASGELGRFDLFTSAHHVQVAAGMQDLVFTLKRLSDLRGHIELSTGDPAEGIQVVLLRRGVQNGRSSWQFCRETKTSSEGFYRFGGLSDGDYTVYTKPAMESETITDRIARGSAAKLVQSGYASVFYPDAHNLADATKIKIADGADLQANLQLTLEPFYAVTATAALPHAGGASANDNTRYNAILLDGSGHTLPYEAQYDQATKTVQALLPDGSYSLTVTAQTSMRMMDLENPVPSRSSAEPLGGSVEFAVAGEPLPALRIPLTVQHGNPIQLTVHQTTTHPATDETKFNALVYLSLLSANGALDGRAAQSFASGSAASVLESNVVAPGSYWVDTTIGQPHYCEESFTAGGASLAREPLQVGLSGTTAPLELTLRDDCATLKLSHNTELAATASAEEPVYSVYVVPDFDSTVDVTPQILQPSSGGTITIDNLTPGNYHVYTFDHFVQLEYRNPAVLAALAGQAVSLSAGATVNLTLETPNP